MFNVSGRVTVTLPDEPPIVVTGRQSIVAIDLERIPKLPVGGAGSTSHPPAEPSPARRGVRTSHRQTIERIDAALQRQGITLELRLAGETVARIGPEANPGMMSRMLLGPIEVHALAALRGWLGM